MKKNEFWDVQEGCSGSGRLSLYLHRRGCKVGLPVDYRYGWDIALPAHRELLDWAEEYRGSRAKAAEEVEVLLEIGSGWLVEQVRLSVDGGGAAKRAQLDAHKALFQCRKDLVQRNANPRMVAERALLAVRRSVA